MSKKTKKDITKQENSRVDEKVPFGNLIVQSMLIIACVVLIIFIISIYRSYRDDQNTNSIENTLDTIKISLSSVNNSKWSTTKECWRPIQKFSEGKVSCEVKTLTSNNVDSRSKAKKLVETYEKNRLFYEYSSYRKEV